MPVVAEGVVEFRPVARVEVISGTVDADDQFAVAFYGVNSGVANFLPFARQVIDLQVIVLDWSQQFLDVEYVHVIGRHEYRAPNWHRNDIRVDLLKPSRGQRAE